MNGANRGDIDIWMVERTTHGWSAPIHLGPEVNSADDELYPSTSADGTMYFASGPHAPAAGKHYAIYRARRAGKGSASAKCWADVPRRVPMEECWAALQAEERHDVKDVKSAEPVSVMSTTMYTIKSAQVVGLTASGF